MAIIKETIKRRPVPEIFNINPGEFLREQFKEAVQVASEQIALEEKIMNEMIKGGQFNGNCTK